MTTKLLKYSYTCSSHYIGHPFLLWLFGSIQFQLVQSNQNGKICRQCRLVISQVDLYLVIEVAEVGARLQSNVSEILPWEVSPKSYKVMVWYVNGGPWPNSNGHIDWSEVEKVDQDIVVGSVLYINMKWW